MAGAPAPTSRLHFLDALRGIALVMMVANHTARDWLDVWRVETVDLIYATLLLPAPIFLFLVGFCLPISYHRHREHRGWLADGWTYFQRGILIVGAGYALNVLLGFPGQPLKHSGVLHTIGFSIILLGPLVPALRWTWTRWALSAAAALMYLSFIWMLPTLVRFTAAHPTLAATVFGDFPPWPWLATPMAGLVLGWRWLETRSRGAAQEATYSRRAALVGLACLALYGTLDRWIGPAAPFGFARDFTLNRHWTPRPITTLLIAGGTALLLAGCWWLMERRRHDAPWLVTLGQTALMLYFTHQIIEHLILRRAFGLQFGNRLAYWAATASLVAACVYLGRAWLALKRAVARTPTPRDRPRPPPPRSRPSNRARPIEVS